MFIVVKNGQEIVWASLNAGGKIITDDVVNFNSGAPTTAVLKQMSMNEIKQFLQICSTKLKNTGPAGKDETITYICGIWSKLMDRIDREGIQRINGEGTKEKLMFVVNDNGLCPLTLPQGAVVSFGFLNSFNPLPTLSSAMASTLTVGELIAVLTDWGHQPVGQKKPALVQQLCDAFATMQEVAGVEQVMGDETEESETETDNESASSEDIKDAPKAFTDVKGVSINDAKDGTQILQLMLEQKNGRKLFIYNFKSTETFEDVARAFQMHTDYEIENTKDITFRIGRSFIEPYETITSVRTSSDVIVFISARLRGGAKKATIKSNLKKKAESKTTQADAGVFSKAFEASLLANASSTFDIKTGMKEMEIEELKVMKNDLKTVSRSHQLVKIEKMAEHFTHFKAMKCAQEKLETAMTAMKELVVAHVSDNYIGDDGKVSFSDLGEMIASTIAVKEASEAVPMAGTAPASWWNHQISMRETLTGNW